MVAIIKAYQSGLLGRHHWVKNIFSGLVVGVVALPLAMAFAIASGAKPEQGIVTAIIAATAVGLFGGSMVQIAGPTGAFIVLLASVTAKFGIAGLQIATLMAGVILLVMSLLRLGSWVKRIPEPVIVGFTAGIGVIIFTTQWKDFFGLPVHLSLDASFLTKFVVLLHALPQFQGLTLCLSLLSILIIVFGSRVIPGVPTPLLALVCITSLPLIFHSNTVATIGSVYGGISNQLPNFHWPVTDFSLYQLIIPAISIAILGAIESLLSATAADKMAKTKHNPNQELFGQGFANILCPLFGGFAATGAIARTATNVKHGGNSPIAAIVHSMFLILVLVCLTPLAKYIPLAVLAAILSVVAYHMSDLKHFIMLAKSPVIAERLVLWLTFGLTIFTNLIIGVMVGTLLAYLLGIQVEPVSEVS